LELLSEETVKTSKGPALKWTKRVGCTVCPRVGLHIRSGRRTLMDDLRRVLATVCSFNGDRRAVLARSHDHCCICGRGLTDELSRSRGIGPECIHKTEWGAFLKAKSLIVPEEDQGTEAMESAPLSPGGQALLF
jgi:hypothetical protein